jgi:hypothetical protein
MSFILGVGRAFAASRCAVDGVALPQAWSLEFDPVGTAYYVIQDGVADRAIAEHWEMPQRLTSNSPGSGSLIRIIPCTASAIRSASDTLGEDSR